MQTQRKTFRLGRRPAKQGPRPLSSNQGRVEKSVTGSPMIKNTAILSQGQLQLRKKLRLGTWNIRSMLQLGKVQLLGDEMMRLGVDICGLSEVRWNGQGHFNRTTFAAALLYTRSRYLRFRSLFLLLFILLSGDIELNPGPSAFTVYPQHPLYPPSSSFCCTIRSDRYTQP